MSNFYTRHIHMDIHFNVNKGFLVVFIAVTKVARTQYVQKTLQSYESSEEKIMICPPSYFSCKKTLFQNNTFQILQYI